MKIHQKISLKFLSTTLAVILLSGAASLPSFAETLPTATPIPASVQPTEAPEQTDLPAPSPTPTLVAVPVTTSSPTPQPAEPTKAPGFTSTSITITAPVQSFPYIVSSTAVLSLSNEDGTSYRAEATVEPGSEVLEFYFDLPEYPLGDTFELTLESGLQRLKYYDTELTPGNCVTLETYAYIEEETGEPVVGNTFIMDATPYYEKALTIFRDYNALSLNPRARIIDGVAMVPVRAVANALDIKDVSYNAAYNSVRVAVGSKELLFNIGTAYTTWDGFDFYAPAPSQIIEDCTYVSLRTLAEAFESELTVFDEGDHMDINLGESKAVQRLRNSSVVNSRGITSKTNYLVWISKSEYKVRVYQGSQYNWELINSFSCAIGAPSSPTVTGQFEYYERISRWPYANFYVGPVMRFHGGYAIHSTLLRYDGSDYDSRTGVKISHGCVRVRPANMNWLINKIPMYTRIYVTE